MIIIETGFKRKTEWKWLTFAMLAAIGLLFMAKPAHAETISSPNLALNQSQTGYPQVSASYTLSADNVWDIVNGIKSYNESPRDRWTNWPSTSTEYITVDFGAPTTLNRIKLYIYSDSGGVLPPGSYSIQYNSGLSWVDVPNQVKTPAIPKAEENRVDFEPLSVSQFRIALTSGGASVGLVELEAYFQYTNEDVLAASTVIGAISSLPAATTVALSDTPAISAVRNAYDALTSVQKHLVTNYIMLIDVEDSLAALAPEWSDIPLMSAFSNAAGNKIRLTMSSVIDQTYALQPSAFHVSINGSPVTVINAVYNTADPFDDTITVTFGSSIPIVSTTHVTISVDGGAFRDWEGLYNAPIPAAPVVTFQKLDQNGDGIFNVLDIVPIAAASTKHIDVNDDAVFDGEDVFILLRQMVRPL